MTWVCVCVGAGQDQGRLGYREAIGEGDFRTKVPSPHR